MEASIGGMSLLVLGMSSGQRLEELTAFNYWTKFAEYATKVGFLFNRRYAPYHKWLWREFEKLEGAPVEVCRLLREGYARVRGRRGTGGTRGRLHGRT